MKFACSIVTGSVLLIILSSSRSLSCLCW